ncbi:hypothetical protein ACSQ67_004734 [Phaseolus vulgaris]
MLHRDEVNPNPKYKKTKKQNKLSPFASDSSGELNILGHNCDPFSMNGTEVSIFKESNQVGLSGFLKSRNGTALESQIRFEVLCDFTNQTLKGEFSDQKLCALLVLPDFLRATVPGLNLWGFFTPPVAGADLRAAFVASCFRGALPPVDLRAVCLVRAIEGFVEDLKETIRIRD